jgi:hypothetical protein
VVGESVITFFNVPKGAASDLGVITSRGTTIEIVSGAAIGDRRTIRDSTDTVIAIAAKPVEALRPLRKIDKQHRNYPRSAPDIRKPWQRR